MAQQPMVQWAVVLHDGSWKIYDSAVAHLLEQGLANHNQNIASGFAALSGTFNLPSGNYQVDFSTMEQINTRTGVRRQVGRALVDPQAAAAAEQAAAAAQAVEQHAIAAWAACAFAWPFWPERDSPDGGAGRRPPRPGGPPAPRLQHSEERAPPWPPPPPPAAAPVEVSYAEALDSGRPPSPSPFGQMDMELAYWERTLPQCIAADGRPRNFSIVRVPPNSEEWQHVRARYDAGESPNAPVRQIFRLQSLALLRRFRMRREELRRSLVDDGLDPEALLQTAFMWHGTSTYQGLDGVTQGGFDRVWAVGGVNAYGFGSYFARHAKMSGGYAANCVDAADAAHGTVRVLLLCAVLIEEVVKGESQKFPPPRKPHSRTGARYTVTANTNDAASAGIFVTYSDGQALPLYVCTY